MTESKGSETKSGKRAATESGREPVSRKDRAAGAIMGTLVGDALCLGCHWYYDIGELQSHFGTWISDYSDPRTDRTDQWAKVAKFRHDAGLRAGDVSQTGQTTILLLESVAERAGYDQEDFTERLGALLASLDGSPYSGRYTDWAMRDVWKQRESGVPWSHVGSTADTAEAAIRTTVLAALFFRDPERLAREAYGNIRLTHRSPYIASQSLSFVLTVAAFINNTPLSEIKGYMAGLAQKEAISAYVPSFDCLTQVGNGKVAARAPVKIEPASLSASLFGLSCTMGFMLPVAYYLIHRYPDDFEMAVLSAVNGGGNNMARAALTGALSGALVGLGRIPERLIQGLKDHERLLELAEKVADRPKGGGVR